MKRAFLDALGARRAVIKHLWEAVLRQAPVHTPLGHPDTLIYMMDETLDRLFSLTRSRSTPEWLAEHPLIGPPIGKSCRCALNPLLTYFFAAESALVATIRLLKPCPEFSEHDILVSESQLLFSLHVLGHQEMNAFCEVCQIEIPSANGSNPSAAVPSFCPFKAELRETEAAKNG
jgi:hypothetical protein